MAYEKTTLSNGVTVVTDSMPFVRSVSIGLWYNVGSRDERADQAGLTHFMEHMMFKGTPTRSAFDISSEFDTLGAELNAFTSKEYTCYYARAVDDKISSALEILADMVIRSEFSDETIEPEREVVIEEIARAEDQPDDVVFDLFAATMLPGHPLGLPVLGTREHVAGYQHGNCAEFHRDHYCSGNLTVAVAGNVEHDWLVQQCEELFASMPRGTKTLRVLESPKERGEFAHLQKDTEQAHVLYGVPFMAFDDDRRFAAAVMSSLLGGSMSSRLFQEVREKRGLVYSIMTNPSMYQGLGTLSVYAGTRPENLGLVTQLIRDEFEKLVQDGLDEAELQKNIESLCGQLWLGVESTSTRMSRLGRGQTLGAQYHDHEWYAQQYRSVTCDDVMDIARELLTQKPTIAVVSPLAGDEVREAVFS